jgi:hypothetical protein
MWGLALSTVSVLSLLIGANPNPDNPTAVQPVLVFGVIAALVAAPVLLVGSIAVGVRMGLDDRDAR